MRKVFIPTLMAFLAVGLVGLLSACNDADVVSHNISQAADRFEVNRRIVFYNGINGEYILTIEGLCSIGNDRTANEVAITCQTGPHSYKKHFLGRSDNVTFFAEQIEPVPSNPYRYAVTFKPSVIIPDVHIQLGL